MALVRGLARKARTDWRIALWIGVALFVLSGLFPPWRIATTSLGYAPLFRATVGTFQRKAREAFRAADKESDPKKKEALIAKGRAFNTQARELALKHVAQAGQGMTIDRTRLVIQWAMIGVVTGAAVYTLRGKKRD